VRNVAVERLDLVDAVLAGAQSVILVITAQSAAAEFDVLAGFRIVRIQREQAERHAVLPAGVLAEEFGLGIAAQMQVAQLQKARVDPVAVLVQR